MFTALIGSCQMTNIWLSKPSQNVWFPGFLHSVLELGMQETRKKISQNFWFFETGLPLIMTKSPMK
jgi:hypothetical protein